MEITMAEFDPSTFIPTEAPNPLQKYFRQPKVYVTLPSKGKFYSLGAISLPENGEIPVFPMTASDELTIKTPDALLNGQATVDVIKSCVPCINDPWLMPSIDLDAMLIALRIATFGEQLDITTTIPGTSITKEYGIDLRVLLNKLVTVEFNDQLIVDDMKVSIRPLNYREFTKSSMKTFEEQRVFALVNDDTMSEEDKIAQFTQSFKRLTAMTIDSMISAVVSIEVDNTVVSNPKHIEEFMNNAGSGFFNALKKHFETEKDKFLIEPITVKPTDDEKAQGAPESFQVPITFDQSSFFA